MPDKFAELERLCQANPADAARQLRRGLASERAAAAAEAAQAVGALGLRSLTVDLERAFDRFMEAPRGRDPACAAKCALIQALERCQCPRADAFLRGAHFTHIEEAIEGAVDTAAPLRAVCALALGRLRLPQALLELSRLLNDPDARVRLKAARAVAFLGRPESALLLRRKIAGGDADLAVLEECFAGLLALDFDRGTAFAAAHLNPAPSSLMRAAAAALGRTRRREAFQALLACWQGAADLRVRKALLRPMAQLRRTEALEFLLEVLREGERPLALEALEALREHRHTPKREEEIRAIAQTRGDLQ